MLTYIESVSRLSIRNLRDVTWTHLNLQPLVTVDLLLLAKDRIGECRIERE